jgi:ferredoxin-type protein NapH
MALRKPHPKTLPLTNAKLRIPLKGRSPSNVPNVQLPVQEPWKISSLKQKVPRTVWRNSERYLGLIAGFFLFIAPFAVFTRVAYAIVGSSGEATIHSICYKLPMELLINGSYPPTIGPIALVTIGGILVVALLFGPLFCGRLCPVGAMSEMLSRIVPIPDRYRMRIQNTKVTASLRYGFLAGFILVGWAMAGPVAQCSYGVDLGRFCSPALMEYLSLGMFSTAPANFWNAGAVLTLIVWLLLGGIMMVGGRGWCMFFCPLGAISGISHAIGARLGFYRLEYEASNCRKCRRCDVKCPMWAIGMDGKIERTLCNGCRECINNCSFNAYHGAYGNTGEKIHKKVKDVVSRVRTASAFMLAAATAPLAYMLTGPCASTGCAGCPLGGACAVSIPLLFGGMLLSRMSMRMKGAWSSLRSWLHGERRKVRSE